MPDRSFRQGAKVMRAAQELMDAADVAGGGALGGGTVVGHVQVVLYHNDGGKRVLGSVGSIEQVRAGIVTDRAMFACCDRRAHLGASHEHRVAALVLLPEEAGDG